MAFLLLAVLVAVLAYIRLAPSDPVRWHVQIEARAEKDLAGGAVRIAQVDLEALNRVILADGSIALAGGVEDGHITYLSRTRWLGFPDYTTVQKHGETLVIYGRLRFGKSDLGVNKRRIEGWLAQL